MIRWLFELIHFRHYTDGLKTIKVLGLRSAIVERSGQRSKVYFYWKFGKYYL